MDNSKLRLSASIFESLLTYIFHFFLRRRNETDIPGARRHHPGSFPPAAQPVGQQPCIPSQAECLQHPDVQVGPSDQLTSNWHFINIYSS